MRRLRIVTVAVVVLTASACGGPVSPSRSELARAEARWASAGIASYTAESRIHCFCPGHLAVWTRLTIRNNQVVETEPLEPLPPGSFATPLGWQTVADLFDRIEELAEGQHIQSVAVQYDRELGFPQQIVVTCRSNVADCGVTYEMRSVVR
ncbi:MAG TPA: DUF6174 domain-containing protein [Vicinamibacterales bacterium]|nr:DUF6174 domain-containing protein [Vicinamibacterales bacterium]